MKKVKKSKMVKAIFLGLLCIILFIVYWISFNISTNRVVVTKEVVTTKLNNVSKNKVDIKFYKCLDDDGSYKFLPKKLQIYTYMMCEKYGIEKYYKLILAQMMVESRYNPNAVSSTDDYGLMQINKINHEWLKEELKLPEVISTFHNIEAGVFMMSIYLKQYNVHQSLSKYNTGTAYNSTDYSNKVINFLERMEEIKSWKN